MALTEQQARAAHAPGSVAVTAGAGTGKTHMLAERYLFWLRQGYSPLQIVAVTFTDKAAAELRSRIRQAIASASFAPTIPPKADLMAELEAAQISTFHALAARICREHPAAAEVPADFTQQDEMDSALWRADHWEEALAALPAELYDHLPYSQLRTALETLMNDPLTAAEALERERADWEPVLTDLREEHLASIAHHAIWTDARAELERCVGPAGDKREAVRQDALSLMEGFETSLDPAYLRQICALNLRGGSAKKWGDAESFQAVSEAIKCLKDSDKGYVKTALTTLDALTPNAYDDQTAALLPTLRAAFETLRQHLETAKREQGVLDFTDLEVHALRALEYPEVQHYYAQRWQAFLIDEFQDTNPTQGTLIERLTGHNPPLTLVGDDKQAIYGFRRADVQVFKNWQQRIHPAPDQPLALSHSFRTHRALMDRLNRVFAPVMADLHQPLTAQRTDPLDPAPSLQLHTVQSENKNDSDVTARRRVEAQRIAKVVQTMLDQHYTVYDKGENRQRPIQPGDIAILARTWDALATCGDALAARGIPRVEGKGGNLLETREAQDAYALLRFLSDSTDNLALATVLRSPFFALSDRILHDLAHSLPEGTTWWKHLSMAADLGPGFEPVVEALQSLRQASRSEAPSRLLQLADRATGYTAVLAHLPGAERRLADWQAIGHLVRQLEANDSYDGRAVVARLQRLMAAGVPIPRPALEAGHAVSLSTIHSAKGLEWPVVIVADLTRQRSTDSPMLRFDAALGVGLEFVDEAGEKHSSALHALLKQRSQTQAEAEARRLLYVALTRARDHLVLTAADASGHGLDLLLPGLEGVVQATPIPYDPALAQPIELRLPQPTPWSGQAIIAPVGAGLSELPVSALTDYALCPRRFRFCHIQGHPGYGDGADGDGSWTWAREIGTLTHRILELGLNHLDQLPPHARDLPPEARQDALNLAQRFRQQPVYQAVQTGQREQAITLPLGGLTLNGVVDLVGDDFVLDFKTHRHLPTGPPSQDPHRFQVWAYARATAKPTAHLAYLRHDQLSTLRAPDLATLDDQAQSLVAGILDGKFEPTPAPQHCRSCSYREICDSRAVDDS